jgi:xanthine dehydrogenase accessory factor
MRGFLEKVVALRRDGQRFATATVVGRRPPVSAHLGDRAIVYADGRMEGFIGGACSREIVRKQALESIRARRAWLVSISPDAGAGTSDPEHVFVPMTCVSEGAVDVYVEPSVQPRRVIVVGATPVAEAVARTAVALDYGVVRVVGAGERRDLEEQAAAMGVTLVPFESLGVAVTEGGPGTAAVVATQGHYDEQALEAILRAGGASYVGLVASRKRGATVRQWLEASGVAGAAAVRIPAGLDLGARTAPEVAISILAEIVQSRPEQALDAVTSAHQEVPAAAPAPPEVVLDPVCHMEVEIATARHTAEVLGARYYFCCANCQSSFVKDPARYLARAHD